MELFETNWLCLTTLFANRPQKHSMRFGHKCNPMLISFIVASILFIQKKPSWTKIAHLKLKWTTLSHFDMDHPIKYVMLQLNIVIDSCKSDSKCSTAMLNINLNSERLQLADPPYVLNHSHLKMVFLLKFNRNLILSG